MKKYFYQLFTAKRYVEQVIMWPFIFLGRIIRLLFPSREEFDIFFFFPNYSIGGAERVNAEIVGALPEKKIIIYFTKVSSNDGMYQLYSQPNVTIKEIGEFTDNKYIYILNFIFRGIISCQINSQRKLPKVFIGQCNFGYKITPHLRKKIEIIELIHVHENKFLWVWAPFIKFISRRIVITEYFISAFRKVHEDNGIPLRYLDKYTVIRNCLTFLPPTLPAKSFTQLKVYYAGRGGHQKRLWILFKIIEKCRFLKLPIEFSLAGSFKNELPKPLIDDGTYVGEIKGGNGMTKFHAKNNVLLMTSAFEGFPMVIMEAMSQGSIVIAPPVDAIPENIQHGKNGFIISEYIDEDKMVDNAVAILQSIVDNPSRLHRISENAFDTIVTKFSKEKFILAYRELLA